MASSTSSSPSVVGITRASTSPIGCRTSSASLSQVVQHQRISYAAHRLLLTKPGVSAGVVVHVVQGGLADDADTVRLRAPLSVVRKWDAREFKAELSARVRRAK